MIYWALLLGFFFINLKYRKNGIYYLKPGFYLFCTASFISIFNLVSVAEFFMRVSFILFIFGFILAVKEYKRLS